MQSHWDDLLKLFSVLAYIIKEKDRSGFEVCFTIDNRRHKCRSSNDALKIVRTTRNFQVSDLSLRLCDILKSYLDEMRKYQDARQRRLASRWTRKPKEPQPIIIYI